MEMRVWVFALVVLTACAQSAPISHASVPFGVVVPAGVHPGQEYHGLQIGQSGDRGVWLSKDTTLTLRAEHPGKKLVLVMYEPEDDNRVVWGRLEGGRVQRECCLHKGIGEVAFRLSRANQARRLLTLHLRIAPVATPNRAAVFLRVFRY